MRSGHKRYFMEYESDQRICGSFKHVYGNANSVKTAKTYIKKCRESEAEYNPRNFRIYDTDADIDPKTNSVPCVYQED